MLIRFVYILIPKYDGVFVNVTGKIGFGISWNITLYLTEGILN
jgi:hypothetical protein